MMEIKLSSDDIKKVIKEIEEAQKRIVQILVPTIIALGFSTGIALNEIPYEKIEISFGSFLSVLLSSGLYTAALVYKIFEIELHF